MKITKKQLQEIIQKTLREQMEEQGFGGRFGGPLKGGATGDDITMNISFRVRTKAGEKLDKASLREFAQKIKEYIAGGEWGFFYASSDHPTKGSYDTDIQPTNIKVTAKKTGQ